MKMSCSVFALLLLSLGCNKEPLPLPVPTPPPNTQPSLKVRWQHALSGLPAGLYAWRVENEGAMRVGRIMVE